MTIEWILLSIIICIIIFLFMSWWSGYLFKNDYIQENFQNVDLPININYSCSNFCGPGAQCAITRDQCLSDNDCFGCQPKRRKDYKYKTKNVPGDDDAGKLTFNQTPQYSPLTTDIGTWASIYNKDNKVPEVYMGEDTWTLTANQGLKYYLQKEYDNDKALHKDFEFEMNYPIQSSITGIFKTDDPPASNSSNITMNN